MWETITDVLQSAVLVYLVVEVNRLKRK